MAYYNFLQEFLSDSRIPPPSGAWDRGKRALTEVLAVLTPDLIVCFSSRNGSRHEVCRVGLACQSAANHCSVGKADGRSQLPHDFQIMTHFLNVEVKEASAPPSIITIWRLQMGCLINRVAFGGTHLAHRQCACNRSSGKLPRLEGRKVKTILNDRKNLIKNI